MMKLMLKVGIVSAALAAFAGCAPTQAYVAPDGTGGSGMAGATCNADADCPQFYACGKSNICEKWESTK